MRSGNNTEKIKQCFAIKLSTYRINLLNFTLYCIFNIIHRTYIDCVAHSVATSPALGRISSPIYVAGTYAMICYEFSYRNIVRSGGMWRSINAFARATEKIPSITHSDIFSSLLIQHCGRIMEQTRRHTYTYN